MIFGKVKKLYIPEGEVKKIECGSAVLWRSGYTNRVPLSIDIDGSIYNGGLGYKNGYRIRSGGAEGAEETAAHTGFIPVSAGDEVRVSGWDFSVSQSANAINVFDASFTNLGQLVANFQNGGYGIFAVSGAYIDYSWKSVIEESAGVWKWIVPPASSGAAYIRVSSYMQLGGDGSKMIVTVNEEIE